MTLEVLTAIALLCPFPTDNGWYNQRKTDHIQCQKNLIKCYVNVPDKEYQSQAGKLAHCILKK